MLIYMLAMTIFALNYQLSSCNWDQMVCWTKKYLLPGPIEKVNLNFVLILHVP